MYVRIYIYILYDHYMWLRMFFLDEESDGSSEHCYAVFCETLHSVQVLTAGRLVPI